MTPRKPSCLGSNAGPPLPGTRSCFAGDGSGRRAQRRVRLFLRRNRKPLEGNGDGVAVAPMLDDGGALVDSNESGATISVHHGLVRLKCAGRTELQLQESRAGDCVQAELVHARKFGGTRARPAGGGYRPRALSDSRARESTFAVARLLEGHHTRRVTPELWPRPEELTLTALLSR